MSSPLRHGIVVGQHGRHCWVQDTQTHERRICHARGKKSQVVVGDRVQWLASEDEGTIEAIEPRRNLLYRSDELRSKNFAANLDQVFIWLAAQPVFSEDQLTRALLACEDAGIRAVIVLNKLDLVSDFATAWRRLSTYRAMGYPVVACSIKAPHDPGFLQLESMLANKCSLVLGPSGSGKSSFTNRVLPKVQAATQEISQALNSGKHTTTSTSWYALRGESAEHGSLIDSPGFQEFGIQHIAPTALAGLMPDIAAHASNCKFYNCTHLHEPGCGVRAALATSADDDAAVSDEKLPACQQKISLIRYSLYSELFASLGVKTY